jgi:PAS domain S-box-containing protein
MPSGDSGTSRRRDGLTIVLVVQVVFALAGGAALISDPKGLLKSPVEQLLAVVLFVTPIILALVLSLRFGRRNRVDRSRSRTIAQLMETVLSTSHEWVWAVDENGLFTVCSPAIAGMLGWEPSELLGQRYDLVIDGRDLARAKADVAAAPGGWTGVVVRCRHRDGTAVAVEVSGQERTSPDGLSRGFEGTSRLLPPTAARTVIESRSRDQLQQMIAEDMLLTAFQPIHSLSTGELLGVEALARFVDEDGAGTEYWFVEAGKVGLLGELEFAALRTALTTSLALPADIYVALNVSPQTCLDPRLPGLLQSSGLPLKRIVLELTERAEVSAYGLLLSALAPLREGGLRIAVDDAGSGFASMRHVLHIRPDIIKLDRSLIAGIDEDPGQHALGTALLDFAGEIGATLVAEGIETAAELAAVTRIGMQAGQGYLLGRPSIHPKDWGAWFEDPRGRFAFRAKQTKP